MWGGYPHIAQAYATNKDGNIITLTDDEKFRVFVFDEEFVDQNVKLQEDGLNTIVMLGQQADLASQITQAQSALDTASQEFEEQKAIVVNEYENRNNSASPKYYIDQMRFALQGDSNWAGRDKMIRGGRQNTGVKDDTYKQFLSLSPVKSRDELIVLFNDKLKELYQAQKGDAAIKSKVPVLTMKYDDVVVKELLAVKIEEPTLSDREKYLLQLVQNGKSDMLAKMADSFGNEATNECPYCLQPVSDEYKKNLVCSIQKILSKIVEEHQQSLQKLIVNELVIDFSAFDKLDNKKKICADILTNINQILRENNSKLQAKIADPYTPIEIELTTIGVLLGELKEELGYCAQEKDFIYCGTRRFEFKGIFHDKPFYDNQVSHVYILWVNQDEENFTLQKEEVSQIKWFDFDDCIDKVKHNLIKHCIYLEELEIVKKGIQND